MKPEVQAQQYRRANTALDAARLAAGEDFEDRAARLATIRSKEELLLITSYLAQLVSIAHHIRVALFILVVIALVALGRLLH